MKSTLLAIALSTAALSAQAADLDYNTVQATYKSVDFDGTNLDGFGVNGSFKFNDSFYGIVGYDKVSKNSADLSETAVGFGFRHAINDKTDWVNELSYVRNDIEGFSDNGYRIATGVRSMVSDKVELSGKVNYTDVADIGKGFGVNLGGVYHVNDSFGITVGYDYSDRDGFDYDSWNVGARFSF
jgi:long-subunit fatty acid transport protein